MNRLMTTLLGLLAFALLGFFCIKFHAPVIEQDVLSRTRQALAGRGVPTEAVSVDGRDVTVHVPASLAGSVGQLSEDANGVFGVRVVHADSVKAEVPAAPAVAPAVAKAQAAIREVLSTGVVEFHPNSAVLTAAGMATLDKIVPSLKESPELSCRIQGYTDSMGSVDYNTALSRLRANATKTYLEAKGIDASRLTAEGFGPASPVADNATAEGRAKNRRIEFELKGRN